MFAAQLLRVLQTLPPNVTDETCVVDTVELESSMKDDQNWVVFEDSDKDDIWNWDDDLKGSEADGRNGFKNGNAVTNLKEGDFFTDKNVTECELPELVVCYRENMVKDICIDNGMPVEGKLVTDREGGDDRIVECETRQGTGVGLPALGASKSVSENELDGDSDSVGGSRSRVNASEGSDSEKMTDDTPSPGKLSGVKSLKNLFDSWSPVGSDAEQHSDQIPHSKTIRASADAVSSEDDDGLSKGDFELSCNSKTGRGIIAFDFDSVALASEGIDESPDKNKDDHGKAVKVNAPPVHDGPSSNNLGVERGAQRGLGESSFSIAGPASGPVIYSGHIPYSGSISIRSDSSTTSTRSFAFPILQNEWNSSPVRMAKADRRQYRRVGSWKHGLFCCRF